MDFHVTSADGDLADKASEHALTAFGVEAVKSSARRLTPPLDRVVAGLLSPLLGCALLRRSQTLTQARPSLGKLRQASTEGVCSKIRDEVKIE
jgi:hypothetical protein